MPWAQGPSPWALVSLVTQGGRLPRPPADQVPGPDRLAPPLLEEYVALLQRACAQNHPDRPTFKEIAEALRRLLEQHMAAAVTSGEDSWV